MMDSMPANAELCGLRVAQVRTSVVFCGKGAMNAEEIDVLVVRLRA